MTWTQNINRNSDEVEHHGRNIKHVVGPIAPAGEESVKVAEDFFRPEIDSTFTGITMGQLDYSNSLRPKEKYERDHPQPDGDAAVRGNRGNHVEVENCDDKQQNQIPTAENTFQVRRLGVRRQGVLDVDDFECNREGMDSIRAVDQPELL